MLAAVRCRQYLYEGLSYSLLQPWGDMGVRVGGDGYAGVAQSFLNHFEVDATQEHETGVGVPEIVEMHRRQSKPFTQLLESPCERIRIKVAPVRLGKQPAFITPYRSYTQPVLGLSSTVAS